MRILAIGTEIVECLRLGRMVERHGESFLTRVYTPRELLFCRERKHATEHFAERWAAKKAVLKCLGTLRRRGLAFTDIEVRPAPDGTPKVYLCGSARERAAQLKISDMLLTLAHCRAYATATAIAVTE